jgi:DNA-binding response OmpR family regulator
MTITSGKKVLLVDDDEALCGALGEQLDLHEEFSTNMAATGAQGLESAKTGHYEIVLLDVGLPDMDGRDVCRLMRCNGVKSPIIMLTGQDSDSNTILDLDAGANDYITKPFKIAILLARMRAHLRQHEKSDGAVFTIGPYSFRPSAKILIDENRNRKVRLTEKEAAILQYLHLTGDRMVKRETLLGEVWGYNAGVATHTLETHVYRLRQKIEMDPSKATILVTDPGGYRLVS